MRIFDTHCHLDDAKFDEDREEAYRRMIENRVKRCVCVGSDLASSRRCMTLAATHPGVYAAAGVHPHEAKDAPEDYLDALTDMLAQAQKVYDETIAEAKAKAEEILSGASERASSGLEDLEAEKSDLQQEVEMLRQTAKDYRERFLRLIEDQQHILNAETGLFE